MFTIWHCFCWLTNIILYVQKYVINLTWHVYWCRSIRRVVFYSLIKPVMNDKGEKEMDIISVSQALQIAGRAGRYGTQFDKVGTARKHYLTKLTFRIHVISYSVSFPTFWYKKQNCRLRNKCFMILFIHRYQTVYLSSAQI